MMEKRVLMILKDEFADWEAAYAAAGIRELGREHFQVNTVSWESSVVKSMGGLDVAADFTLKSVPSDYEAVLLIGGTGWRAEDAKQIKPLVCDCIDRKKIFGAICDAVTFAGTLGVLNHVKHTCNDLTDLKTWAAEKYTGESFHIKRQAVRDGTVITANGTAALEFAREVLLALHAADEKAIWDWYGFHKNGLYGGQCKQSGEC